jgi:Protein of unknown function (DUF2934)
LSLLRTDEDFVIIDFEGESAIVGKRQSRAHSAGRDVETGEPFAELAPIPKAVLDNEPAQALFMTSFATVSVGIVTLLRNGMAKNRRSDSNDNASSPAQPRSSRRMTGGRKPAPSAESGSTQETASQEGSTSDVAQDFRAARQSAQYESTPPEPSEHEIRVRAYLRYLERGAFDGADFDDWLQAEMELKKR